MTQVASFQDEMVRMAGGVVAEPALAADAALANALQYCADKLHLLGPQSALDHLCAGHQAAHGYFQFALAGQVADYLAGLDAEVKAVYLYDYDATPEDVAFSAPQPIPTPHLIVRARRKTEALYALGGALDRALAANYAERAGLPTPAHMLDVQIIDDGEAKRGLGYGALLNSLNLRPLLVWQR